MRGICSWALLLTVTLLIGGGCDIQKGRFASCDTDADCKNDDDARPYCIDLQCYGCAYDRHCEIGQICDMKKRSCVGI